MNIDPLADERDWITPYNYVQNTPLLKVDPNGLTDFSLNKKTGEINQVGDKNDSPDRIVKTDKNGNVKKKGEGFLGFLVKKSERGKDKVEIGDIEKGILKDGMNFKTEDNVIDVGGVDKPSMEAVEDFVMKLSNLINKEIAGYELSNNNDNKITNIYLSKYKDNTPTKANSSFNLSTTRPDLFKIVTFRTHFHTHLSRFDDSARLNPSTADDNFKRYTKKNYPDVNFKILTTPKSVSY